MLELILICILIVSFPIWGSIIILGLSAMIAAISYILYTIFSIFIFTIIIIIDIIKWITLKSQ